MAEEPRKILVVEHERAIGRLLQEELRDDGHDAEFVFWPENLVREVRDREPDLLVVDLAPSDDDPLLVLDALRSDPVARRIPVIVTTTQPTVAEQALASYNVHATLLKPFDLEQFVNTARRALTLPMLQPREVISSDRGLIAHAERVLAERSREAVFRWVQRLEEETPWDERPNARLSDLIDSVPVLLSALDARLHYGSTEEFLAEHPETFERVREHARTRIKHRIPLTAIVREYAVLRSEIWLLFGNYLPDQATTREFLTLEQAVNEMLDHVVESTIAVYSELQQ